MPYAGSVLVQGNRIRSVGRSTRRARADRRDRDRRRRRDADARHVRGAHALLVERRGDARRRSRRMPLEEHVLWCAKVAKRYLEAGWTSCVGAACAKPRLDVVTRNAINSGQIPGPRYLAASQEITVPGGLGDETLPHLPFPEFSFGVNVNSARRDEEGGAHVPQVRRRLDQAQPLGRQLHARFAGRDHLDERRRGRRGDGRGAGARQARHRARALGGERSSRRCATAST